MAPRKKVRLLFCEISQALWAFEYSHFTDFRKRKGILLRLGTCSQVFANAVGEIEVTFGSREVPSESKLERLCPTISTASLLNFLKLVKPPRTLCSKWLKLFLMHNRPVWAPTNVVDPQSTEQVRNLRGQPSCPYMKEAQRRRKKGA